jgi:hypothetical protein
MKKLLVERFQELAGIKPLYEVEDLELKSLAKKFIPIIKKYKMGVEYETDTTEFESKPKDDALSAPAKLLIKDGILTVAVYFLSLASSLNELDMGSGPSKEDYKKAESQAGKMYKELIAVLPKDEFEFKSDPEMNDFGYYLLQFRKK